jgi:hypothetical protein
LCFLGSGVDCFVTCCQPSECLTHALYKPRFLYKQNEGNLRGAEIELFDNDRDLAGMTIGAASHSLKFSVSMCSSSDDWCLDFRDECDVWAMAYLDTEAKTWISGSNVAAIATSDAYLWLDTACEVYSEAYAKALAFVNLSGAVKVTTSSVNHNGKPLKDVSLSIDLDTATCTYAMAKSKATADAYANVGAQSYTDAAAFCTTVQNMSPLCAAGSASTDLYQYDSASATAKGTAGALASSGSVTRNSLSVSGRGASMDFINGMISVFAKSWASATAGASANAYADAFTVSLSSSYSVICVKQHEKMCKDQKGGMCDYPAADACAKASSFGLTHASAFAHACASKCATAQTDVTVDVSLSANVNCGKDKPKLEWACTNAYANTRCH